MKHLILLALLILSSCASGPKFAETAFPKLAPGHGRLFVYRSSAFGAAYQPMIMVDGKEAGRAKPKGFAYIDLPAGLHKAVIKTEVTRDASINVAAGQNSYLRVDVEFGLVAPRFPLVPVPANEGAAAVARCKYVR